MKNTIEVITELKRKGLIKDYAIGGAIGTLRWVEPFFTRDLDVFIIPSKEAKKGKLVNLSDIYDYLKKKGYIWKGQWIMIEGVPVDLIPADEVEKEAIENAKTVKFEGIKGKVMTPEYLVVLFLKAGRDKDLRKIQMLLSQAKLDKIKLKRLLDKYNLTNKYENNYR